MTQSQVMEHLAQTVGISKKDAKLTLDELNTLVVRELKKEGSIRLGGLGIFASASSPPGSAAIPPPANRSRFQPARGCASRRPRR